MCPRWLQVTTIQCKSGVLLPSRKTMPIEVESVVQSYNSRRSGRCRKEFHGDYEMQIAAAEPDLTCDWVLLTLPMLCLA